MEADLHWEEQQRHFGDGSLLGWRLLGSSCLGGAFGLTGQGGRGGCEQGPAPAGVPPRLLNKVRSKVVSQFTLSKESLCHFPIAKHSQLCVLHC